MFPRTIFLRTICDLCWNMLSKFPEGAAGPVKLSDMLWLENAILKPAAAPVRLSEVLANITWESLQRAGADCCVPVGLASTLMCNYM